MGTVGTAGGNIYLAAMLREMGSVGPQDPAVHFLGTHSEETYRPTKGSVGGFACSFVMVGGDRGSPGDLLQELAGESLRMPTSEREQGLGSCQGDRRGVPTATWREPKNLMLGPGVGGGQTQEAI